MSTNKYIFNVKFGRSPILHFIMKCLHQVDLVSLSLFHSLAKEDLPGPSTRVVHGISCPVYPRAWNHILLRKLSSGSSREALLLPVLGPSLRPSQGTCGRVTKCTQLVAPPMSFLHPVSSSPHFEILLMMPDLYHRLGDSCNISLGLSTRFIHKWE